MIVNIIGHEMCNITNKLFTHLFIYWTSRNILFRLGLYDIILTSVANAAHLFHSIQYLSLEVS